MTKQMNDGDLECHLRSETTCHGCGKSKESGMLVCWDCFKHVPPVPGIKCLKDHDGDLCSWVRAIDQYREYPWMERMRDG